jgi:ferrous iron transport protein B
MTMPLTLELLPAGTRVRPSAKSACAHCPEARVGSDASGSRADYLVAVGGNPNTGKSTVFNAITGLRQHVGNWPGKTVARAVGQFEAEGKQFALVDLPGTYSLLSMSVDEEIARDFLLFGRPDCIVIVVDATVLERNLNLVLQVLEVSDRVVVCLNLMDEARRKGIIVDHQALASELGVPVVPTTARTGRGIDELIRTISEVCRGSLPQHSRSVAAKGATAAAISALTELLTRRSPTLPSPRWIAIRLLEGDARVERAITSGQLGELAIEACPDILEHAHALRGGLDVAFRDQLVEAIYEDAQALAARVVRREKPHGPTWDARLDQILTSRVFGLPIMTLGLAAVFWLTIVGANYPSALLAAGLFAIEKHAAMLFDTFGAPEWLTGFLWHGVYRGLAWVVSVMLPPMAIFFPTFTILENLGYLPRVAFNLDRLFQRVGAHGKQALTMSMGFGCNAAGVIACRVINSPRERLIAILTNNFVPCNGRFPTLIMLATVFVAAAFPPALASLAAAASVVGVVLVGVLVTLLVSWGLSRTILRGEASSFTLELPPYRRPNVAQILYTSLIDRTLFVLWRAIVMAAPAGGLIWLLSHFTAGGTSLTGWIAGALDPIGRAIGLDGVILLAYVIAIPANEIVVPTILMAYAGSGMLIEIANLSELRGLLVDQHGWTLLTAVCLMLFSVLHNPCSTTIWTIYKETGSARWTTLGALMPLLLAFVVTFAVAQIARLLG